MLFIFMDQDRFKEEFSLGFLSKLQTWTSVGWTRYYGTASFLKTILPYDLKNDGDVYYGLNKISKQVENWNNKEFVTIIVHYREYLSPECWNLFVLKWNPWIHSGRNLKPKRLLTKRAITEMHKMAIVFNIHDT
jgi:hypothetical protein